MDYTNLKPNQEIDENGLVYELGSLYAYFQQVTDPRHPKGKLYSLPLLLVLMLLAKLGGEDKPSGMAEWVAQRAEGLYALQVLPRKRAPSHMTYRRVLQSVISPTEFERLVSQFHQSRLAEEAELVLSMDGKTLRGTIPRGQLRGTHLLSTYAPRQGLVLAQAPVDQKENEIVVAPEILQQVNLSGVIVMADAMHAQKETSRQVVAAGGNYVWTVKGNQPRTAWAIEKLFAQEVWQLKQGMPLSQHCQRASAVQKGHGRVEKRTILVSSELNEYLDWPGIGQVFRLEREVWHAYYQGRTRQVTYGMTSLSASRASPQKLLRLTRQYWGIESGLHYRRDVTLQEDRTRLQVGHAGQNMAILNNLVVGLCLKQGWTNLARARRLFCAHPNRALDLLTCAQSPFL
jgi:predicted transposase YbfD/YdcC